MIEKTILDYLTTELDVSCYMEVPKTAPSSFVVIEKTGSNHKNRIFTATVAIQSYAESLYNAAELDDAELSAVAGGVGQNDGHQSLGLHGQVGLGLQGHGDGGGVDDVRELCS